MASTSLTVSAADRSAPLNQRPSTSTSRPSGASRSTQRRSAAVRVRQRPEDVAAEHDVVRRPVQRWRGRVTDHEPHVAPPSALATPAPPSPARSRRRPHDVLVGQQQRQRPGAAPQVGDPGRRGRHERHQQRPPGRADRDVAQPVVGGRRRTPRPRRPRARCRPVRSCRHPTTPRSPPNAGQGRRLRLGSVACRHPGVTMFDSRAARPSRSAAVLGLLLVAPAAAVAAPDTAIEDYAEYQPQTSAARRRSPARRTSATGWSGSTAAGSVRSAAPAAAGRRSTWRVARSTGRWTPRAGPTASARGPSSRTRSAPIASATPTRGRGGWGSCT